MRAPALGTLIWHGDLITSVLILFVAVVPTFPLYAFFYGLFGGWDDHTLEEVGRAANLSGLTRPFARLFWAASSLGARISPLHGRFRMDIRPAALEDAASLTAEKVSLLASQAEANATALSSKPATISIPTVSSNRPHRPRGP